MRIAALIVVPALAVLTAASAQSASGLPPATVSCESIVLSRGSADAVGRRVVLGVVSVPPAYLPQVVPRRTGPWTHWSKAGLAVRGGSPRVRVSVPRAWRSRVRIGWGDGGGSFVRFASCPAYELEKPWNGYAGGFFLRSRSVCVPLIFRVGQRSETVRFGIGRRCLDSFSHELEEPEGARVPDDDERGKEQAAGGRDHPDSRPLDGRAFAGVALTD